MLLPRKERINNMKIEIGKLYKTKFERTLFNKTNTMCYNIEADAIFLLLDVKNKKRSFDFDKYKILTPDGISGWIITGMKAESLIESIS